MALLLSTPLYSQSMGQFVAKRRTIVAQGYSFGFIDSVEH